MTFGSFYLDLLQFSPLVITGFALLTAIALQNTPIYSAVITRLIPLATALYSTRLFH